jgi:capsular polysaccharide export protein
LRKTGAAGWRVGFNAGEAALWWPEHGYIPFHGPLAAWPAALTALLRERQVTDIVLYGDTRPVHAEAVRQAHAAGLRVHVFEEGYLRPYWVTYERDGSNGHSRLMTLSVPEMQAQVARSTPEVPTPPAHWGDMRQHVFWGAAYHWFVIFRNTRYPQFAPHRALPAMREAQIYTKRLFLMPFLAMQRALATKRIQFGGYPYHLALLQLEHDASFQAHSPFETMAEFLEVVIDGFAKGAPHHHHLVFKAHPLESGQSPIRRMIRSLAAQHGITKRVHYVRGGKLARLLDQARSAVTVNSTAGQQALWRGIPLKIFGTAVYGKPAFVSGQPLRAFFAHPQKSDSGAYRDYRHFLLQTSQVPGGYYSTKGRRQLLRQLPDMMLASVDPYHARLSPPHDGTQPLRVVE